MFSWWHLSIILCGCMMQAPRPAASAAELEITHLGGTWLVQFRLPDPVKRYVFKSTPEHNIRKHWKLVDPGLQFVREGERDVITGAERFEQFTLEVAADNRTFPGGYSLTQEFSNGEGWVLYTGYFMGGKPIDCPDGSQQPPPCAQVIAFDYLLQPRPKEHIWARGNISKILTRWPAKTPNDAMIYFGSERPKQAQAVQWLTPSDFPQWINELVRAALPKFIEQLTQRYEQVLSGELYLIMNQSEGDGSFTASVLRDHILFELKGQHWAEESERSALWLLEVLAHEIAHLWNGGKFKHDHSLGHSWLHEGGATAASSLLMREHGESLASFFSARTQQLNSCLDATSVPLRQLSAKGRYSLHYSCGAIIELAVESALRKLGKDGFTHWRKLYADLDGSDYNLERYVQAVVETTADPALGEWIRQWAEQGLSIPADVTIMLKRQGLQLKDGPEPDSLMAVVDLLRPLLKEDCGGGFSISTRKGRVILHERPGCAVTKGKFASRNASVELSISLTEIDTY